MLRIVTDGAADIVHAYALFRRTLAPAGLRPEAPPPAHMELLIDRQGYIRARWIPGEGRQSWSDLKVLRDEIQILAGEAAVDNSRAAVQILGGMGFTWDMAPNFLLKRAWVLDQSFGTPTSHALSLAAMVGEELA